MRQDNIDAMQCGQRRIISHAVWPVQDNIIYSVASAGYHMQCGQRRIISHIIGLSCSIPTIVFYLFSLSLLSVYIGWYCGAGVFELIGCIPLSQPCTADLF